MSRKQGNLFVPAKDRILQKTKPTGKINIIIKKVRNKTDVYTYEYDIVQIYKRKYNKYKNI